MGLEIKVIKSNEKFCLPTLYFQNSILICKFCHLPASRVSICNALLNGPCPAFVTAADI